MFGKDFTHSETARLDHDGTTLEEDHYGAIGCSGERIYKEGDLHENRIEGKVLDVEVSR